MSVMEVIDMEAVMVMLTILQMARLLASMGKANVQALSGKPIPPGVMGIIVRGNDEANTKVASVPTPSSAWAITP